MSKESMIDDLEELPFLPSGEERTYLLKCIEAIKQNQPILLDGRVFYLKEEPENENIGIRRRPLPKDHTFANKDLL